MRINLVMVRKMITMPKHYQNHEFEALQCRFENQTELLYRLTLLDLRIFTGYITLQLALGAWMATHPADISSPTVRAGLLVIDLSLAVIATAFVYNNYRRRLEIVDTVKNCNEALGYEDSGVYLESRRLNAHTVFRPWCGWYYAGIVVGFIGTVMVLFGTS